MYIPSRCNRFIISLDLAPFLHFLSLSIADTSIAGVAGTLNETFLLENGFAFPSVRKGVVYSPRFGIAAISCGIPGFGVVIREIT